MRNAGGRGSAYVFVLVTLLLLFLMLTAALTVTSTGRAVSQRYADYASLYELAAAGNETALFFMRGVMDGQADIIAENTRQAVVDAGLAGHLVYKQYAFHLAYPEDGYYAALYREAALDALTAAVGATIPKSGAQYVFTFSVEVDGDVYDVQTALSVAANGFVVRSAASLGGAEVAVEAEIVLATDPHTEIWTPVFTWRGTPPPIFTGGVTAFDGAGLSGTGSTGTGLSGVVDETVVFTDTAWRLDNALTLLAPTTSALDLSAFYAADAPIPTLVVMPADTALYVFASDAGRHAFRGIIVANGDVTLSGVAVSGAVVAGGAVTLTNGASVTPVADGLFAIPLSPVSQREALDFFRLARFAAVGSGRETDIDWLLPGVVPDANAFAPLNNFDAIRLEMVKSKKIAP